MCSRYYIEDSMTEEIRHTLDGIDIRLDGSLPEGDIHPADNAPVITGSSDAPRLEGQRWGYPGVGGTGLIINARSETVRDKRMFIHGIRHCRIVVPAVLFYEWDRHKTKYLFRRQDARLLYLAGIAERYEQQMRFVILTTQANASMAGVHDRMPLILEPGQLGDWLDDDRAVGEILRQTPAPLIRDTPYEQLTLFDN